MGHYVLVQVLFVLLALGGLAAGLRAGRRLFASSRVVAFVLLAIVALSLFLRFGVAEAGVVHENYCGVGRASCAGDAPCRSLTGNHGVATFAAYNVLLPLVGSSMRGLFTLNGLLGGVVHIVLLFALVRLLLRRDGAALAAAAVLAVLPVHVRLSVSDAPYGVAISLLLGGLLALAAYARSGRLLVGAFAAAALALFVQTLLSNALAAPAALVFFLLLGPERRRVRVVHVLALSLFFLALVAPHAVRLLSETSVDAAGAYTAGSVREFLSVLAFNNLYLESEITPLLVSVAAIVGLLVTGLRRFDRARGGQPAWAMLVVFLSLALVLLVNDPRNVMYPTRLRMQLSLAPFVAFFAGAGLSWIGRRGWPARVVALLVLAGGLWQAGPQLSLMREQLDPARELHYITATLPTLPEHDVLIVPDFEMLPRDVERRGDGVEFHFPRLDLRKHHPDVRVLRLSNALKDLRDLYGKRVLFYRGIVLSAWLPEELAANPNRPPHRPEWDEAGAAFVFEPVDEAFIEDRNPDSVRNHYVVKQIPVGFYWARPTR